MIVIEGGSAEAKTVLNRVLIGLRASVEMQFLKTLVRVNELNEPENIGGD